MQVKLGNYKSYNYRDIINECEKGGRFVVYQWIIPLPLFMPIKRLSKVYFIDAASKKSKFVLKYNILNLIFGWWGLPFGPPYLFKSILLNTKGGVDVTEDIMLNINEAAYASGKINIIEKALKYMHPPKTEKREFTKVFKKLLKHNIINHPPVIGYFIDTAKNEQPYYVIGISESITPALETAISKEIYHRFYKSMEYQLVDINAEFDNKQALISQGLKFECN